MPIYRFVVEINSTGSQGQTEDYLNALFKKHFGDRAWMRPLKAVNSTGMSPLSEWKKGLHRYISRANLSDSASEEACEGDTRSRVLHTDPHNLVSSEIAGSAGRHTVCLDIDCPMVIVESKTPGHYHLIFPSTWLTWPTYKHLLEAMRDAAILQEGYVNKSIERGATFLRAYPTPTGFDKNESPLGWPEVEVK